MEDLKVIIGQNIKRLRKQNKDSLEKLSSILGTDKSSLSRNEKGDYMPRLDRLRKVSKHYNVTIAELCGLELLSLDRAFEACSVLGIKPNELYGEEDIVIGLKSSYTKTVVKEIDTEVLLCEIKERINR